MPLSIRCWSIPHGLSRWLQKQLVLLDTTWRFQDQLLWWAIRITPHIRLRREVTSSLAMLWYLGQTEGGLQGAGSTYVFTESGSTWTQDTEISASVPIHYGNFGTSLSLSGSTLVSGAIGSAYIFTGSGSSWTQSEELTASNGTPNTQFQFGFAVVVSGSTIFVTAPEQTVGSNVNQGAVYVFTNSGSTWMDNVGFRVHSGHWSSRSRGLW